MQGNVAGRTRNSLRIVDSMVCQRVVAVQRPERVWAAVLSAPKMGKQKTTKAEMQEAGSWLPVSCDS